MSKKTEAQASSTTSSSGTAASNPKNLSANGVEHKETNGHTTALDLNKNTDAMLSHKKRGDTLVRDDEREELMMTQRGGSTSDDQDGDKPRSDLVESNEQESTGSLSGADTWNFVLLVVL
ncbi:hypothetical protein BGZ99_008715, partial [Dissophora globulifera]